jgi:hypothetical protein
MFKMQTYIIFVFLFSSGAVSADVQKVLKVAQFYSDIYKQLPRRCIFIINPEAQQPRESEFCIIYVSCAV